MQTKTPSEGRFGRREILFGLGASAALPLLSGCGRRAYEELPPPTRADTRLDNVFPHVDSYLNIKNAHTDERVAVQFMKNGRESRRAIRKLDWVFRDWREDEAPDMDRRIYWGLATLTTIARQNGHSGEITLLSGFRTPRTTQHLRSKGIGAATKSYHMRRRAADIRLDGVPPQQVANVAEWLQIGGVGRYGDSFTHIDTGPIRTWGA
ncbi:Peptidase M15 [Rhodobacteraceae bacterium THAF1]|uniref:YcbK family protein n=1 Tax=Palleronia sp. THAF1 TaxID=2587842 RepID=UPI000F3CA0A4|nr:DUF882 domain-containing protein [Palleronia sp. THAF1]QFU09709.1 Peptidase M15 [Palleronia sp. THAF1]VDC17388.1 Peptidase M15 [Rhodobacteraceae bacterium THAF1]